MLCNTGPCSNGGNLPGRCLFIYSKITIKLICFDSKDV